MMGVMNYHELTIDEPRTSWHRRAQFTTICAVIIGVALHSLILAGAHISVDATVQKGKFPGGSFVYKLHQRDYAAAYGLIDEAAHDLEIKSKSYGDLFYSLYLDNPLLQSGPQQRFATGILVVNRSQKALKQQLLDRNQQQNTKEKDSQTCHQESWMVADLPSVNAAVLQYPCTNGFVSLLITSYKIIPALRKYAKEHGEKGNVPVVISTCSPNQSMCTHYAPLVQGKKFLLGQPDSQTFSVPSFFDLSINWAGVRKDMKRIYTFLLSFLGF